MDLKKYQAKLTDLDRLNIIENLDLVDSLPEEVFDRLTRLAAKLLPTPVSLVSIVDDHRQFFKSFVGLEEPWASRRETPLSHSFCQHVVVSGKPLIVENAPEHPLVKDNLAIPDLGVISYVGMPLTMKSGHTLGSFCVIDSEERHWRVDEIETVKDLAQFVITELELRHEVLALQVSEQHRRELIHQLEEQNQELEAFARTVAHDLKNPASSLLGYADLFADAYDEFSREQIIDALNTMAGYSRQMIRIIDALLLLASTRQLDEIPLETLDMKSIIDEAIQRLQPMIQDSEATITIGTSFPDAVGYTPWIEEVMVNYLSNAIKYGGRPPVIEIASDRVDDDTVSVWVRDNGKGLTPEQQAQLFQPFKRVTELDVAGHGLGLSIVRQIIERLNGTVYIKSELDIGSEFGFTLPIQV